MLNLVYGDWVNDHVGVMCETGAVDVWVKGDYPMENLPIATLLHGDALGNARLFAASNKMLEALRNLENDDGAIPEFAWAMVQDAIKLATSGEV